MTQYHFTVYWDSETDTFHIDEYPEPAEVWDPETEEWRPRHDDEDDIFIDQALRLVQIIDLGTKRRSTTSDKW